MPGTAVVVGLELDEGGSARISAPIAANPQVQSAVGQVRQRAAGAFSAAGSGGLAARTASRLAETGLESRWFWLPSPPAGLRLVQVLWGAG